MIRLDIAHSYQNVAMTTFLHFHGNVLHFVGESQENEMLIKMFVKRDQYKENSGGENLAPFCTTAKSPNYCEDIIKVFDTSQRRMDIWKKKWCTLQLHFTDLTL